MTRAGRAYLELVLPRLSFRSRVEEINGENLLRLNSMVSMGFLMSIVTTLMRQLVS
jgi:hypothetical protein